jgi:hypothetical protein
LHSLRVQPCLDFVCLTSFPSSLAHHLSKHAHAHTHTRTSALAHTHTHLHTHTHTHGHTHTHTHARAHAPTYTHTHTHAHTHTHTHHSHFLHYLMTSSTIDKYSVWQESWPPWRQSSQLVISHPCLTGEYSVPAQPASYLPCQTWHPIHSLSWIFGTRLGLRKVGWRVSFCVCLCLCT